MQRGRGKTKDNNKTHLPLCEAPLFKECQNSMKITLTFILRTFEVPNSTRFDIWRSKLLQSPISLFFNFKHYQLWSILHFVKGYVASDLVVWVLVFFNIIEIISFFLNKLFFKGNVASYCSLCWNYTLIFLYLLIKHNSYRISH